MLQTEPMQKVRIIAVDSAKYELVKALQALGAIDIRKSKLKLSDDAAGASLAEISEQIIRVRSALAALGMEKKPMKAEPVKHVELQKLLAEAQGLKTVDRVLSLSEERRAQEERLKEAAGDLETVEMFLGTRIDFRRLTSKALGYYTFTTDMKNVEPMRAALKSSKVRYELITKNVRDRRTLAFIAFDKSQRAELLDALRVAKSSEITLSNELLSSTPERMVMKLRADKGDAKARIERIGKELAEIRDRRHAQLVTMSEMLDVEYDRANVSTSFKRTERTFMIEGWVPKKRFTELRAAVSSATRGNFEMEEIHDKELAPTLLNRPGFLKPFDYLMEFYSVPRSDEIDPTWIFIGSLAVLYGIMISDVGYGVMSLALAWLVTKKTDPDGLLNNIARIWMLFSVSIIAFGLLSNEFLGLSFAPFNGIRIFDWVNGVPELILITVLIGTAEVLVGQVFSFFNKLRHHERKLAISKLISIPAIVFGVIALGGGLFHAFSPQLTLISAVIAAISFAMTAALSGIEAAELASLIAHPLSFSRLLGFGLASVVLSFLIDKAFVPTLSHGILVFIVFLVIFIVLHALNMLLSIFEGIVQGARLNFVEFFSKFYIGNGVKFRPYYFRRRYTKE